MKFPYFFVGRNRPCRLNYLYKLMFINSFMKNNPILNFRQIRYFRQDKHPEEKMIKSLITETYNLVPSKQKLVPYKIHVFGPNHSKEKEALYLATKTRNVKVNTIVNYQLFASYVLLFTSRLCDNPNEQVKNSIKKGHRHHNCDLNEYKNAITIPCMEIGMFCDNLAHMCLNNNLDIAYTGCFPMTINHLIPEIKEDIYLAMSIGYADDAYPYRKNKYQYKPDIKEIIDWH